MAKLRTSISRRGLIKHGGAVVAAATLGDVFTPYLSRAADRPILTHGIQSGDVGVEGAIVWARADRPSRIKVDFSTTDSFKEMLGSVFRRCATRERSDGQARVDGPAPWPIHLLPRRATEPCRTRHRRRAHDRALSQHSRQQARRKFLLVWGYLRPRMGHRRGPRRHAALMPPCASTVPISSFTMETTSTPTGRSCPKSSWPTANYGKTS